jgi:hypothetical protein
MAPDNQLMEMKALAQNLPDQARQIVVSDAESYLQAGELLVYIKQLRKKIIDTFRPIKQRIDESKKAVLIQERAADIPLAQAEQYLTPQIIAYDRRQEHLRQQEELRLKALSHSIEEDRRLMQAIAAENAGAPKLSQTLLEEPLPFVPVMVPKSVPKVAGLSIRKNYGFTLVNQALLPREYLTPDLVKIGGVVRALKDQCRIPGVEVHEEQSIAGVRFA